MVSSISEIITIYHKRYGVCVVSNKQMHKRLKTLKKDLLDFWEEQSVMASIDIGDGRTLKMKKYPELYWQLHVHALRKYIIQEIQINSSMAQ